MQCPKCSSSENVRAGFTKQKQRYKCKACQCHYTRSTPKGYSSRRRKKALQLYLEGLGFRAIGRILNVSNVTVLNWIREEGESIPVTMQPEQEPGEVVLFELDEMWHYVQKKTDNAGYGLLLIASPSKSVPSKSAVVVWSPLEN